MDFLLIALLMVLNGVFAMSELALASSRRARLTVMAETGDKGALAALQLLENPTQFLSTVQVGITSIGMLNGILGEAAFSQDVAVWLQGFGMTQRPSELVATALVVTLITFATILFGELVPKRIGQLYPEPVSRWVARPMSWVATGTRPFVSLLSVSTHWVLKLLRIDNDAARGVTEEEITASLEEGLDAGVIEQHEHQMVQNVFRLDDRPLTSLMVPRSDIVWLDASDTAEHCLRLAGTAGAKGAHSWYPVCRGGLDDVIGVIGIAKLLQMGTGHAGPIEAEVMPAVFIPETLSGMELLERFRLRADRMVFVVDEYGVVQGLMTPRDLLEAITGELTAGEQTEAWAIQRDDGSWLIDGLMPVSELKLRLLIDELPDETRGRYNTMAGLLMAVSGRLPATGDRIDCAGWRFEVVDRDGKRIDKVLATALEPGSAADVT